jgi:hypothetical protein
MGLGEPCLTYLQHDREATEMYPTFKNGISQVKIDMGRQQARKCKHRPISRPKCEALLRAFNQVSNRAGLSDYPWVRSF